MIKIASTSTYLYLFDLIQNEQLKRYKTEIKFQKFSDGEMTAEFKESIRGCNLYLFGDTSQNLTELLLTIDSAQRSSCKSITIILPYYGYGRGDKQEGHRGCLGAGVMAQVLQDFKIDTLVSIDLHSEQIKLAFRGIPVEHIKGHSIFIEYLKNNINLENTILCSPDSGGVHRVERYCQKLKLPMVSINKRRDRPNEVAEMQLIGSVKDKNVIIIDDMIDTCGTLKKAVEYLKEEGALDVSYIATHPILSGKALENLKQTELKNLIISNTNNPSILSEIKHSEANGTLNINIHQVSCIPVLEQVIINLINGVSISQLND